jgi:hypothetical protein
LLKNLLKNEGILYYEEQEVGRAEIIRLTLSKPVLKPRQKQGDFHDENFFTKMLRNDLYTETHY